MINVIIIATLESRIIGGVRIIRGGRRGSGVDIVIMINKGGWDGVEKIVQAVS